VAPQAITEGSSREEDEKEKQIRELREKYNNMMRQSLERKATNDLKDRQNSLFD